MKKTIIRSTIMSAIFITAISCNNHSKDSKQMAKEQNEKKFEDTGLEPDAKFVVDAAEASMLEIQLGKLAQTNASSPEVKQLGMNMIEDHSKASEELKSTAEKKNISIPSDLSDKKKDKYNDFAKKTGKNFDKEYTEFMVKDHKKKIDDFRKEADKGHDADIKSWASGKVPVLEHHLHMAQSTCDDVKNQN